MSYIIIKIYSFACGGVMPGGRDCVEVVEVAPVPSARPDQPLLEEAHRLLRKEGWQVVRQRDRRRHAGQPIWLHYCSAHRRDKHLG